MDIFIDLDSTTNDFTKGYVSYYNKLYNKNVKLKKKDLLRYEISKTVHPSNEKEAEDIRSRIFSIPEFWTDLPLFPNAASSIEWIFDSFNTYIITAPWIPYKDCLKMKWEWIENNLPFFPLNKVIFSNDKSIIHKNSILIDDHPKHLIGTKGHTLKMNYPFNEKTPSTWEANNWKQILSIMKKIKKDLNKNGRITRY